MTDNIRAFLFIHKSWAAESSMGRGTQRPPRWLAILGMNLEPQGADRSIDTFRILRSGGTTTRVIVNEPEKANRLSGLIRAGLRRFPVNVASGYVSFRLLVLHK